MKNFQKFFAGLSVVGLGLLVCVSFLITAFTRPMSSEKKNFSVITSGEYFVVNLGTGEALTPVASGVNENAYLSKFNKSGMQKWTITKKTTKNKAGKISVYYTFKHSASEFYLRPYFVPANHSGIISTSDNNSSFSISGDMESCSIKSNAMGGDAMYSKKEYASNEAWFAPLEESDIYKWKLVPVE